MVQHVVKISDSNGAAVTLKVSFPPVGESTWEVVHHRFLRLQKGVVDKGKVAPGADGWIACYGGREIDDTKLVLHLDGFLGSAQVNRSGAGKLYNHDNLLLIPGALTWKIAH